MKRPALLLLLLICFLPAVLFPGCSENSAVEETIEGNMKTYARVSDGTWTCEEQSYAYRLEVTGRVPNAAKDVTYVYLSNLKEISFERAYKAAGISSYSGDYFTPAEAVLVEMK